ncbi:DoxX family protein, partial [Nocardia cyriacigeorgica]|nr:DoxX family protein [Nocardia cyriacigeorgica]NEW47751.1 DoxX family protein [Nocardia cyriacigeorgica]NEW59456.1 DoxX family protein [Nocardia cyriacigeorgica]
MLIRRLARPLLASAFVVDGVDTLMHPEPRVKTASAVVQKGQQSLPSDMAEKLPNNPSVLVKATAVTQVAGGAMLALGKAPRLAALAIIRPPSKLTSLRNAVRFAALRSGSDSAQKSCWVTVAG